MMDAWIQIDAIFARRFPYPPNLPRLRDLLKICDTLVFVWLVRAGRSTVTGSCGRA